MNSQIVLHFQQRQASIGLVKISCLGVMVVTEDGLPLKVRAHDDDVGLNGFINYRIVSPFEPYFMVDYVTGVIRTKAILDYEKVKRWSFYVQASDMGSKALSSSVPAMVTIVVGDVNDVPPRFGQKEIYADLVLPTLKGVFLDYYLKLSHRTHYFLFNEQLLM